jgi:signal transduction histidine kinase
MEDAIQAVKLSMEHRKNIYLVCKEAINNAVKYSCGHVITIAGRFVDQKLIFCVEDNGKGFPVNNVVKGNGLKNMQERANESKMQLSIKSTEGQGTTVLVTYPITQ